MTFYEFMVKYYLKAAPTHGECTENLLSLASDMAKDDKFPKEASSMAELLPFFDEYYNKWKILDFCDAYKLYMMKLRWDMIDEKEEVQTTLDMNGQCYVNKEAVLEIIRNYEFDYDDEFGAAGIAEELIEAINKL